MTLSRWLAVDNRRHLAVDQRRCAFFSPQSTPTRAVAWPVESQQKKGICTPSCRCWHRMLKGGKQHGVRARVQQIAHNAPLPIQQMPLAAAVVPHPPLHSNHPCVVSGGAREPSLSVLQIYSEGRVLSFSCASAGWTRWYYASQDCACHRGWSPLPSPLPSLLRTLPNLMPNPQPRVQPSLVPRWQPSLQLESPYLWPLLSMCSSSQSDTPARKSGIQSLFLSRAEHASHRQFLPHFLVHMPLCLHDLFRVAHPLHSNGGGKGTVTWGMCPRGSEDTVARRRLLCKGVRGHCCGLCSSPSSDAVVYYM